jgi:D-methionine transport system permease protein
LIGATAMAGAVGAGGIGDLAISYGYQRFDQSVVYLTVIVLLVLVQIVQGLGNWLSKLR